MMDTQPHPAVEVIVLNWNGRAFLPDCLAALARQDYPNFSVTVVDNDSTDGSAEWVRVNFPRVRLIVNAINLGFAAGNNAALKTTTAAVVALLNPDVMVADDWLTHLVAALNQDDRTGIVGSKLWYPDGRTIQHGGGFLRPPQAMPGHYAIGETDTGQADEMRAVEYVIGAAMAIHREVLQSIGLFDEGYFLYFEDTDYCRRGRDTGWQVVYAPQATAVHVESATAVKDSFAYLRRFHTGRWRYILKHLAAETILTESIAAERAWLGQIAWKERVAALLAYQSTISRWDEIRRARRLQGAGELPEDVVAALRTQVVALRDAAQLAALPPQPPAATGEPSTEQALRAAVIALARTERLDRLPAAQDPDAATATTVASTAVAIQLSGPSQHAYENYRRLSELHMIHAAQAAEARQLAQSVADLQQQLDGLEARLATLGGAGTAATG